jgi:hypothetical protein
MSLTNDDLKRLLLNLDNTEEVAVIEETPAIQKPVDTNDTVVKFIREFNLVRGEMKVPNYILYYLYKVKYKVYSKKVGLTEFFRQFKKYFDMKRSGDQRFYMLGEIELTEQFKTDARIYVTKMGIYNESKQKKRKKKIIS